MAFQNSGSVARPVYDISNINGLDVISFTAGTRRLAITDTTGIGGSNNLTVLAVSKWNNGVGGNAGTIFSGRTTGSNNAINLGIVDSTANAAASVNHFNGNNFVASSSPSALTPMITGMMRDGSNVSAIVGNTVETTAAKGGNVTLSGAVFIGTRWDGSTNLVPFDGDIGEILIFNKALTPEELAHNTQYLANKWGITL